MAKIISEWQPLNDGRYILTLDEKIPTKPFKKYRIAGKDYEPEHFHIQGEFLLKTVAIKGDGNFIGKEITFID